MHFDQHDVLNLFLRIPYMKLAKAEAARWHLKVMVRDGHELHNILAEYPNVMYEPLENHYAYLACLSTLSEELVDDLCSFYAWKGIVWAAWLATLSPERRFRKYLVNAREFIPHSQWLVDLAIDEIDGVQSKDNPEVQDLFRQLRTVLVGLPKPIPTIRLATSEADIERVNAKRLEIRTAYLMGGANAAIEVIRDLSIGPVK